MIHPLYSNRQQEAIFIKAQCNEKQDNRSQRCLYELRRLTLIFNEKALKFIIDFFNKQKEEITKQKLEGEINEYEANQEISRINNEMNELI